MGARLKSLHDPGGVLLTSDFGTLRLMANEGTVQTPQW